MLPQSVDAGVIDSVLSSGAGTTVTVTAWDAPAASCTVTTTVVLASTGLAESRILSPAANSATGSTAELLENAR